MQHICAIWLRAGGRLTPVLENMLTADPRIGSVATESRFFPQPNDIAASQEPVLGGGHWALAQRGDAAAATGADGRLLLYDGDPMLDPEDTERLRMANARSDTPGDLLLSAFRFWGAGALRRLRRSYACMMYRAESQQLVLARDPMGVCPLYFMELPEGVFVASTIEALLAARPEQRLLLNHGAVARYTRQGLRDWGYETLYKNIYSVPAGGRLVQVPATYTLAAGLNGSGLWSFKASFDEKMPLEAAVSGLRKHVCRSVARHTAGPERAGLTLSGGMDSAAIAAAFVANHPEQDAVLPCYTVQYADPQQDESPYALAMAAAHPKVLKSRLLSAGDFPEIADIEQLTRLAEEPFHDPVHWLEYRQLQTMQADGMEAYLNGIGGDDLFMGFDGRTFKPLIYRYLWHTKPWLLWRELPFALRSESRHTPWTVLQGWWQGRVKAAPPEWSFLQQMGYVGPRLPDGLEERIGGLLGDFAMRYALRGQKFARSIGITPRMPLLDEGLVQFCLQIPPRHWLRWGIQKYALRRAFAPELPLLLRRRVKKTGFPFDTAAFLRLRRQDWLRALDGVTSPAFGMADLAPHYEDLLVRDPQLLWRLLNYLLWIRITPHSAYG